MLSIVSSYLINLDATAQSLYIDCSRGGVRYVQQWAAQRLCVTSISVISAWESSGRGLSDSADSTFEQRRKANGSGADGVEALLP